MESYNPSLPASIANSPTSPLELDALPVDEPRGGENCLILLDRAFDSMRMAQEIPRAIFKSFEEILTADEATLADIADAQDIVAVLPDRASAALVKRATNALRRCYGMAYSLRAVTWSSWTPTAPFSFPSALDTPGSRMAWLLSLPDAEWSLGKTFAPTEKPRKADDEDAIDYDAATDEELGIIDAGEVEPEEPQWLWPGRFYQDKLHIVAGEGGDGKTTIMIAVGAPVTTQGKFPDGQPCPVRGRVMILAAEDGAADTIIPRFLAAGADVSNKMLLVLKAQVCIPRKGDRPALVHPVSLQNLAYWRAMFRRYPTKLLIIDPIPAYLGRGVNDHRNADVQSVLTSFVDMAAEFGVCVVGITHTGKAKDLKMVHRVLGSVAYTNCARVVHVTARDPEDETRRYLARPKANLDEPRDPLAYKIVSCVATTPSGKTVKTSRVEFESEPVKVDVEALAGGAQKITRGPEPKKTLALAEWLFDFLEKRGIPTPLGAIIDAAGEAGFVGKRRPDGKWSSVALLYQAKDRIPSLTEDRSGRDIEESKAVIGASGRAVVHWHLTGHDPAFQEGEL